MTGVGAWVLTYALHSTLLVGAIVALDRAWGRMLALDVREALLKASLAIALVTSLLPWGATWTPIAAAARMPATGAEAASGGGTGVVSPARPVAHGSVWLAGIGIAWAAGAAFGVGRLAWRLRALRGRFGERAIVTDGRAHATLARLAVGAGLPRDVRLTRVDGLASPVVLRGREICVPGDLLDALPAPELEAMLAHELAHVARRDACWLVAAHAAEALFFVQPLHRIARRALYSVQELRADDWAVRATGERLALARCLGRLVDRMAPRAALVPAMAVASSGVLARVTRLVRPEPRRAWSRAWAPGVVVGLAIAVALFAPRATAASMPLAPLPGDARLTFEHDGDVFAVHWRRGECRYVLNGAAAPPDRVVVDGEAAWLHDRDGNVVGVVRSNARGVSVAAHRRE